VTQGQRYTGLFDILLTVILLLVRLSKISDTRLSTPDQRYMDPFDILLTFILLLVRLSEMSDTRLFVTSDSVTQTCQAFC